MNYIIYILIRLVVAWMQAVPLSMAQTCSEFFAFFFGDILQIRSRIIEENLCRAFPELDAHGRKQYSRMMWRHLFLLLLETVNAQRKIHLSNWKQYVKLENEAGPLECIYQGRSVMFVVAHYGNFEFAGYILGLIGIPAYVVARRLDNPYLNEYMNSFRRTTGMYIIPKNDAAVRLEEVISNRRTLVMLADQHAGIKGCKVDFFGEKISAYKAVAVLGLSGNANMVIASITRHGETPFQCTIRVEDSMDPANDMRATGVKEITRWYIGCFEQMIRTAGWQYWWIHKRWGKY